MRRSSEGMVHTWGGGQLFMRGSSEGMSICLFTGRWEICGGGGRGGVEL